MMKNYILATSATLLAFFSIPALAHPGPSMNERQYNQERRINHGIYNGELTRHEVRHLDRGQAYIQHLKYRARADGVVTPYERHRIRMAQRDQSHRIYDAKHNQLHDFNHNGIADRPYRY